jgi:hypothetical protein
LRNEAGQVTEEAKIIVVGGHSRSVGKTSLVVDIVSAFPEARWTAVKITQYGHGICSVNGENCDCGPAEHLVALDEERDQGSGTDSSRFLTAGAVRAWWLRTKQGELAEAMPLLRTALAGGGNVIIESNTLLQFLRPSLYLMVLDPATKDFKASARLAIDRADAFVLRRAADGGIWRDVPVQWIERKPQFLQPLGQDMPRGLQDFIVGRFFAAPGDRAELGAKLSDS